MPSLKDRQWLRSNPTKHSQCTDPVKKDRLGTYYATALREGPKMSDTSELEVEKYVPDPIAGQSLGL